MSPHNPPLSLTQPCDAESVSRALTDLFQAAEGLNYARKSPDGIMPSNVIALEFALAQARPVYQELRAHDSSH